MFRVPLTALIPTVPDYTTVAKSGLTAKLFGSGEGSEGADFGPGKVLNVLRAGDELSVSVLCPWKILLCVCVRLCA